MKNNGLTYDTTTTEKDLDGSKTKFDRTLTSVRVLATRGVQWFLPFWYSREPMFWLPYGWFPYYVEWFASFPRAPLGSVSIVVWQWACTGVLALVIETVMAVLGLIVAARQQQQEKAKVKQAVPAAAGAGDSKAEAK